MQDPASRPVTTSSTVRRPVPIRVSSKSDLPRMIEGRIPVGTPVIVVVGGASGLGGQYLDAARRAIVDIVVPVAVSTGAAIVDGGTDSGVMAFVGRSYAAAAAASPLIGVAVEALVRSPMGTAPSDADDAADAEPHHSHLILVPGQSWGDESPWLSVVAEELAAGHSCATVVVNGGPITLKDVRRSVAADRPVVAMLGTGRTADDLAAAVRGDLQNLEDHTDDAWTSIQEGIAAGLVTTIGPDMPLAQRRAHLEALLRST
jgi:hypothetical protein